MAGGDRLQLDRLVELRYDKHSILQAYLNEIYFGQRGATAVHGVGEASGPFRLDLSDNGVSCGPFYPTCSPAHDECFRAEGFHGLGVRGDNTEADTDGWATCAPSDNDVWYEYNPGCHGFATFDTCESSGSLEDTVLSVLDECDGYEMACSDDAPDCGLMSSVTVIEAPDDPLIVRLAGYSGEPPGSFNISVSGTVTSLDVVRPGFYTTDGELDTEDWLYRFDVLTPISIEVGPLGRSGIVGLTYAPGLGLLSRSLPYLEERAMQS